MIIISKSKTNPPRCQVGNSKYTTHDSQRFFLFLLLLTLNAQLTTHNSLFAAFEFRESGARGVGLSGAFTAQANDATAPFWNPAGLRLVSQIELSTFFNRFYSVSDLDYLGAAIAAPTPLGGLGFAFSQFGPSDFRENQIYLSHAFELIENVFAGYNLKTMLLKIEGFGSASTFGFDAGVLGRVTENLNLAFVGKNLNRPVIGVSKEPLPTGFVAGVAFRPIEGIWLTGEFERIDPSPTSLKSGIEFMLAKNFTFRGGLQNNPTRFTGGIGMKAGIVRLDYAYIHHTVLTGNHQFSLSFKFGEPKEDIYKFKKPTKKGRSKKKDAEPKASKTSKSKGKFTGKVNLATATAEDLTQIEDVGLVTAGKIVEYRDQFGIKTIDDLLKVPGMRRDMFNAIKKHSYIEGIPIQSPPLEKGDTGGLEEEILLEPKEYEKLPTESVPSAPTSPPSPLEGEGQVEGKKGEGVPKQETPVVPPAPEIQPEEKVEEETEEKPVPAKPNLNHISVQELSNMGLSSVQIKNIMRYREKRGGFKSMDELKKLPGIDAESFEKLNEKMDVK